MCEVLDKMINEGYNKGISIGRSEGISIGEARGISIGRSEGISIGEANAKKKYEAQIAEMQAELAKYREALKQ